MTRWFSPTRLGFASGTALVLCGSFTAIYGLYGQVAGRISEEAGQVHPAPPEQENMLEQCIGAGQSLLGNFKPPR